MAIQQADPILRIPMGTDPKTGLKKEVHVTIVVIDSKKKIITIVCEKVLISPVGDFVCSVVEEFSYQRFNIKAGYIGPETNMKQTTQDNLKYDQLRASEIGSGVIGLIAKDFKDWDGTVQSLMQNFYTE